MKKAATKTATKVVATVTATVADAAGQAAASGGKRCEGEGRGERSGGSLFNLLDPGLREPDQQRKGCSQSGMLTPRTLTSAGR